MSHTIHQIGKLRSFSEEELPRLQALLDQILDGINDNPFHQSEDLTVTVPAAANTTFAVTLKTLGKTPTGYVVIAKDRACDVYTAPATSSSQWVRNRLYLRSSVGSAVITLRVV